MKRSWSLAKLETEHVFRGSVDKVFSAIGKYDLYPDYLPGVTKIEVLPAKATGSRCQVRYELNLIKKFYYVLDMFEEAPNRIWWKLDDSNLMKQNDGSWEFTKKSADATKARYTLDVKFKGLVPSSITDQIAKANLPAMLTGFQKLIDDNS
jgi:ribosome-associated toxin RatA of RatAB toxin-antitoxin module